MPQSLHSRSRILYADDDADDIELFRDAFQCYSKHIALQTFYDGTALLDYIRSRSPWEPRPCLIILDINMPRLNGKQTLEQLRNVKGYEAVPVVLFSTSNMPSEQAFASAFDAGFVTKPLHAEQIHQIIDQMLGHCSDDVKQNLRRLRS